QGIACVVRFEYLEFPVGNAAPGDHAGGVGFGGGGCALAELERELDALGNGARAEQWTMSRIRIDPGRAGALRQRDLVLNLLATLLGGGIEEGVGAIVAGWGSGGGGDVEPPAFDVFPFGYVPGGIVADEGLGRWSGKEVGPAEDGGVAPAIWECFGDGDRAGWELHEQRAEF